VAINSGDLELARRAAEVARQSPPFAADATFRLALIAHLQGDTERARAHLAEVSDSGELSAGLYFNLARLSAELGWPSEEVRAWYDKARAKGLAPQIDFETKHFATPSPE
jgi:hypothetical protein